MKLYIVEEGKLVEYERLGECNQCGECCGGKNTITYQVQVQFGHHGTEDTYDPFKEDWSKWEGFTLLWAQNLWWYFKATDYSNDPDPCEWKDPETKLCLGWKTEDWPAVCRYWPFRPSDLELFPNCGFDFRKLQT